MNKLDAIRAKLQQIEEAKSGNRSSGNSDKALYPHWDMKTDDTGTIRFLPDANDENPFFWKEKQMIKLPFPGVKGQDESKEVVVQVPCVEMWGDNCPILAEVRPMFNDKSLEDIARKYWKKRSYVFQGFVQHSPFTEEEPPENPIRKFIINPGLFNIIKSALMDPDLEEMPTDYLNGLDFRISKTQKGQYADYTTSKYARKETALAQDQLDAIEEFGLVDLETYLPKRPDQETLAIIHEMFQASIEGELYDPERFGKYYRPFGVNVDNSGGNQSESKAESKPAPRKEATTSTANAEDDDSVHFESSTKTEVSAEPKQDEVKSEPASADKSVNDILAMVRNRKSS